MGTDGAVYWDPFDADIARDPYPTYRRLREEAPLYYNDQHDFYAVSRFADCERVLTDWETFSSARGNILEVIQSGMEIPPGTLLMDDPPRQAIHRSLLVRVFTPRRIAAIEPQVREFCVRCLDPLVGAGRFDLIAELGAQMPMRVISMLLGIPESDQEAIRDHTDNAFRTEVGQRMDMESSELLNGGVLFDEYIEWRSKHPSDDLMTDLLQAEFEDETGQVRTLTREEITTYIAVVAGAGNETTNRLIGWTGALLDRHPDQRTELVDNPGLVPNAIEEVLRFEPPGPAVARYVTTDTEFHGQPLPAGSALTCIVASANRDDRRFPDGDRFDINRKISQHATFGLGTHYCLGAALARLEGRVALEEMLKRFPKWEVDWDNARLASTSTVRGWETLPLTLT